MSRWYIWIRLEVDAESIEKAREKAPQFASAIQATLDAGDLHEVFVADVEGTD